MNKTSSLILNETVILHFAKSGKPIDANAYRTLAELGLGKKSVQRAVASLVRQGKANIIIDATGLPFLVPTVAQDCAMTTARLQE